MFGPLIELIECQDLYNILNEGLDYAKISDPYYLYLLDCRPRANYNESHIVSAKNVKRNDDEKKSFRLPYESELECRNLIVVYDGNTSTLEDNGMAMECAQLISENGSKNSVKILKGGYELFTKYYPFLRSQQIMFMPRELDEIKTYPTEIIPGLLYLGNLRHGTQAYIKKDLKLKSYLDFSNSTNDFAFKNEKTINYLKVHINDEPDAKIDEYLDEIFLFLDTNIRKLRQSCLVFSNLGISRAAAIVIAYLAYADKLTVQEAYEKVSKCRQIQPQICFLEQIEAKLEKKEEPIEKK